MSMEIKGSAYSSKIDYAEQMREKEALRRAEKAKEADKTEEAKTADEAFKPKDEYVKSGRKPTGLYRVEQDENGNRKIFFEDPAKSKEAGEKEQPKVKEDDSKGSRDSRQPNVKGKNPKKPEEKCIANTDKVDREIEKLKEKKRQITQQIQSASGDEKKVRELERKLAQVENELSQKDNDTYRRQHTSITNVSDGR